ncbi:MAG: phage tail protein [Minisyncoccota bacterium]
MNTKITFFSATLVALLGIFTGVHTAFAESVATSCTSATFSGSVAPNGSLTEVWFEWGTTNSLGNATLHQVFTTNSNFTQVVPGLTPNTTYYYRAIASNVAGTAQGSTFSFVTPLCETATTGSLPTITTSTATNIAVDRATLNAFVNPNGTSDTAYWFEWGTTTGLGNQTPRNNQGIAASNTAVGITGLAQNTTYYYRVAAQNAQGTVYGSIVSFTTSYVNPSTTTTTTSLPAVSTSGATSIAADYAVLGGYVNPLGTSDTTRWFEWGTTTGLGNQTPRNNQGIAASSFSETISGLAQNTTYYYRAVAQNSQGVVYGSIVSFVTGYGNSNTCGSWGWGNNCGNAVVMVSTRNTDVSGDFAVLNGYVDPNGTNDTVRWFEWGGSQALGNSTQKLAHGSVASSFGSTLTGLVSNTTYYYRAVARNSSGTVYGSILSFTTGYTNTITGNTIAVAPTATTLLATELTSVNAKLNGLVFTSAGQPSNAWFEWGTSSTLGNKTQTYGVGSLPAIKHSDFLTGLTSGQTYYYRVVAENPYGRTYGTIVSFVAERRATASDTTVVINTPVRAAAAQNTTVVNRSSSTSSLAMLAIDGGAEVIVSAEKRSYHIMWKNESTKSLKNVVLRVSLPSSMKFESATNGSYSSVDNTVTVDIKTLEAKQGGELFIFATADRRLPQGQLVVVTANMVYTDVRGVQGDAIAYVTHRGEQAQNDLTANIFGAGSFVPTTILGWMTLLVLVLALVLLGNHLYGRLSVVKH